MRAAEPTVLATHDLVLTDAPDLAKCELMSPYVWRHDGRYHLLIRVVATGPGADTGCIRYGTGTDGLTFAMVEQPAIAPSLDLDIGGCEDPTVVRHDGGLTIFYTGVRADGAAEMLWASGADALSLEKRGIAFHCSKTEWNTKEATVEITPAPGDDGGNVWRLFYEYSHDNRSHIGFADGEGAAGPWVEAPDPIVAHPGQWDCHHLSTGPMVDCGGDLLMFYNGADEGPVWSIGWARFARDCRSLLARGDDPLIRAPGQAGPDGRRIAFAASALLDGDEAQLYYSIDDRLAQRATIGLPR